MAGFGAAAVTLGMAGLSRDALGQGTPSPEASEGAGISGGCQLPPLPYAYDALEPYIDQETLSLHHTKHHAAYVKGFNDALAALAQARASGEYGLIKHWSRELAFHGSGHVLHALYWENMGPKGRQEPEGDLMETMRSSFGDFSKFKAQFLEAATAVEASGWGILVFEPFRGRLMVMQAEKHQDLTVWGVYPLLICDVWEHAYYLRYQNRRKEYVSNFFQVIRWEAVEQRFHTARKLRKTT